jgi:phosphoglycerol transferase MdoB-like AlkP superfamily enzyme
LSVQAGRASAEKADSNSPARVLSSVTLVKRIYRGSLDRLIIAAIWLPVGLLAIYVKFRILGEKQWRILAHAFHRASTFPAASHFTALERATVFSADLLVGFAVVPIVLVLLMFFIPRKLWSAFVALISILISLEILFQMQAFKNVGHFIPWYLVYDVIHWAIAHPQYVLSYGGIHIFYKWACFIAVLIALAVILHWSQNALRAMPPLANAGAGAVALLIVVGAVLGAFGMDTALGRTWLGRAEISATLSALLGDDDLGTKAAVKSNDSLHMIYAAVANSAPREPDQRYFGKASGSDVIVFILETAPYRYDSFESLDDLPNLKRLASHAWIGCRHYSTFPYTAKATFSILTSMYPPNPLYFGGSPKQAPGLVRALASAGYDTHYYVPHQFETHYEDAMYEAIGFNQIFSSGPAPGGDRIGIPFWQDVMRRDLDALHTLMRDAHEDAAEHRPYLAVFSPQIGHAPWPDIVHDGAETSLGNRARALLILEDQWLGQIVEQLLKDGRLDHTIIVVTGDHGVRTSSEDPSFETFGLLPDYSFHVPLLIFAPQALQEGQTIRQVTSHIDIAPTALDLVGIKTGRGFEEGLPIWDPGTSQRKVFLWAGDYLGAEGFEQGDVFTVWNKTAGYVFTGKSLDEDDMRMIPAGSAEENAATRSLQAMARLDGDWWVSAIPPLKMSSGASH